MMATRWRKLARDLSIERGRTFLMIVAISLSLVAVGAVLGAYGILTREVSRNYLGTRPASAAFELAAEPPTSLVDELRQEPGIADAERGEIVLARAKVGPDWIPLLLFVVDDFRAMRLNTFTSESGAWPPPDGTMLMERSAKPMLMATLGDSVLVKTPNGQPHQLPISGVVHDPGLAPAWQEREGYGYITRATLAALGEPSSLKELRVLFAGARFDRDVIEARAAELARWLAARGQPASQIRVPPPGRHPHQTQMMGVLYLMLAFSVMALILSGILVATSLAAILGRQVREIGVMKTVGASSRQIAGLYAVLVAFLGVIAVGLALPVGVAGARGLAAMSARMLNLVLESQAIPWWVFAVQAGAGVLVPLIVAAFPIARGSRNTVRDAIDQHGVSQPSSRQGRSVVSRWLRFPGVTLSLALRNAFRRRTRLALTVLLLAAGGAMFMTALNISRGWNRIVDRVYENRSYDVEVRLNAPAAIAETLRAVPGVRTVEPWGYAAAALARPDHLDVVRTYPDGSHGSLAMMGPPPQTGLVHFPLLEGRWLAPGDTDAVVLNHMAAALAPRQKVGDALTLSFAGRPTIWKVVGIVEEVGSAGVAYVSDAAFAKASGVPRDSARMLRLSTSATSPEARAEIIRAVEARLEQAGANVNVVIPLSVLRTAMGDHVLVLIRMLLAMAALMVTVGLLGLASTMGTSVVERTRELGIMKTLGATPRAVWRIVVAEALLVALLSWTAAGLLTLPLTSLVGKTVGMLSFRVRLPFVWDMKALAGWLGLVLAFAAIATLLPARRASRLTVRDALGHV